MPHPTASSLPLQTKSGRGSRKMKELNKGEEKKETSGTCGE